MIEEIRIGPETEVEIDTEIDPVCGTVVEAGGDPALAEATEYEGRLYLFCGPTCRATFERMPKRFAAAGRSAP